MKIVRKLSFVAFTSLAACGAPHRAEPVVIQDAALVPTSFAVRDGRIAWAEAVLAPDARFVSEVSLGSSAGDEASVLDARQGLAVSVLADPFAVFVELEYASAAIVRIDDGGASTIVTAEPSQAFVGGLVADDASVYFARTSAATSEICAVPRAGGALDVLAVVASPVVALAGDGARLFAADEDGSVWSVPIAGGAATLLAGGAGARDLALDADHVYWKSTAAIARVGKDGGAVETLATGVPGRGLAVDHAFAWWYDPARGVMRAPLAGGAPEVAIASPGSSFANEVALDGGWVYWSSGMSIFRARL